MEIFDEIDAAKEQVMHDLLAEGILEETDERARKLVRQMLGRLHFAEINVTTQNEIVNLSAAY